MSDNNAFNRFENKGQPQQSIDTKIVAAYGLGKCPKLAKQIAGPDLDVRRNALIVLCDEFQNPLTIEGCCREGVISVIAEMVSDADFITRVRASQALALAARDSNGFLTILETESIPLILHGVDDPSEVVRGNVYNCLLQVTRSNIGVETAVKHKVVVAFVKACGNEMDTLKPIILQAIHNMVGSEDGLLLAIEAGAVSLCIDLLKKSPSPQSEDSDELTFADTDLQILSESARTLGFMCFDGRAKLPALQFGAIAELIRLLKIPNLETVVKQSVTIAVMAITITDEGKIQIYKNDGVDCIMALLYDDSKIVLLNALKIISNVAVYPRNRDIIVNDSTCVVKLRKLAKSEDPMVSRHASIALAAASWTP